VKNPENEINKSEFPALKNLSGSLELMAPIGQIMFI